MENGSEKKPPKAAGKGLSAHLFGSGSGEESINWRQWLIGAVLAAIVVLLVYSLIAGTAVLRNVLAALLVAGAAAAVGVILGFLFGIPRSLQRDDTQNAAVPFQSVRTNTNLEQISDWLTKIIVGVGLAQAGKIILAVEDVAARIGPLFVMSGQDATRNASAFVLVVMILFSILGFLVGYLWARIYLQEAFNDMEQRAQRQPEYFEGLMNSYLYMPAPKGFTEALKLRDQYKARISDSLTDRMWTYLVCALGQQYKYKNEVQHRTETDLAEDKREFEDALRNALRNDPEALSLLRLQLEPDKTNKNRGPDELFDGDLRSFKGDVAVRKLLDLPVP